MLCAAPAQAAFGDPLRIPPFSPSGGSSSPPSGYFDDPCGLAVDSGGDVYIADHYNDRVYIYSPDLSYETSLNRSDPLTGPCRLALDDTDRLYVGDYHGEVNRFGATPFFGSPTEIDGTQTTGVAVDPALDRVYVNDRTHVSVYDYDGNPVLDGAEPLAIGEGSLGDGYGLAVSRHPATLGYLYVADATDQTVKVYDPGATDTATPVDTIERPGGGFTSLRDSEIAVDWASGDTYVVDYTQPDHAEQPRATVEVFDSSGGYQGHLKYDVVHGAPTGLAVDNSGGGTQGRVYITTGNARHGGLYAYPPGAATATGPLSDEDVPPAPPGGGSVFTTIPIGGPATEAGEIPCEGDSCQVLPSPPIDPTLTTRIPGLEEPAIRYRGSTRNCGAIARRAAQTARQGRRLHRRARRAGNPRKARVLRAGAAKLRKRSRRFRRLARGCRLAGRGGSASAVASTTVSGAGPSYGDAAAPTAGPGAAVAPSAATLTDGPAVVAAGALDLLPGAAGFEAQAWADGGEAATLAGSHPYSLDFAIGLDQSGEDADLRELRFTLPAGLLANPAAVDLCQTAEFFDSRDSPYEESLSGESCPERTQVGTIEATISGGQTRSFGLFNLEPAGGTAAQLGASPFGLPLVFDVRLTANEQGDLELSMSETAIPQNLGLRALGISIWGAPWATSHDTERGNCLNEAEPGFAWSKCEIEGSGSTPRAFLTLPTECGEPLAFTARTLAWQETEPDFAGAVNRDTGGEPAPLTGCDSLGFDPDPEGVLSVSKASTSTGFAFRMTNEHPGLTDPYARIRSHPKQAVVELPRGVTLNPSLGAGLRSCSPSQLAAETAFNKPGDGCPNGSKIGTFRVRTEFYEGLLDGSIYLAKPRENPFGSLLAVYLVAKSVDRGILIRLPGELAPDPGDGTITAIFDRLPQLPYTDLRVNFRSGQRAPLVSPPYCGAAPTETTITPWAAGAPVETETTNSSIDAGIAGGPCPDGSTPPFDPGAVAGGVNSNVGSYTPYYVHLSREDTEQEITSYSLVLPKGITGKLKGVPFCSDAAIERARGRDGLDEIADPSCPSASQVGSTNTGYGVGPALTYAPGRIYLAGPTGGEPLSLVTINAATVGPFDLGTIVIRSAFSVDPRTAQLQIDSSASDPIPHIIDGVPLHLRDIRITMDRFQFTRNPTSCRSSQLVSTLTGSGADFSTPSDDSTAEVAEYFQLLNCLDLGFTPRLGLQLLGGVKRSAYPALRAVLRAKDGDASMERMEVTMPKALFLAQNHIRGVCTRPQFAAERCPKNSIYGRAVVYSSLFDEPLKGPVYLRSSDNVLPDLVASLRSGEVRIVLEGRIGPSKSGGVRAFFDNVPDAPIEAFVMQLNGGRRGLLVNSVNVCNTPPTASVKALGQNNKGVVYTTKLRGNCKKFKAAQKRARRRAALKRKRAQRRKRARARARAQASASAQPQIAAIGPARSGGR